MTSAPVILCTDTFADRYGDAVEAQTPGATLVVLRQGHPVAPEQLGQVDVAYFSHDVYPERTTEFMSAALSTPSLQWLQSMSAGIDHPIFATFRDRGVILTTSSGSSAGPIARTVLMYLLALSRDLPARLADQVAHRWNQVGFDDLEDQTLGVIGLGPIGLEIGRMAEAIGMTAIGLRRTVRGDEPFETWTLDRLGELADRVDALAVALPLHDSTRGIISAEIIGRLRPGAYFVNVGRGELVDEDALIEALRAERLGGAGLDVFTTEPLPADSRLWSLPNVIITPHNSAMTSVTADGSVAIFLDNLAAYAAGTSLRNVA